MNFTQTWAMVRRAGGVLWLRFDDADEERVKSEYVREALDMLHWLGLPWDEALPSQQGQREKYWAELLKTAHYVCDCSRKQLQERGVQGHYDGHCRERRLPFRAGKTQVRWRSAAPQTDVVLWRKEDIPAYHLTSVVDDIAIGTNLVVRGEDLRESSELQRELARSFGAAGENFAVARFVHHGLLLDEQGHKLAKSLSSTALAELRAQGLSPLEVFTLLSERTGWPRPSLGPRDYLAVNF